MTLDAVRLAVGTLTVLPTRPPHLVDRPVAGWAMALAPLVGALLAVPGGLVLWLLGPGPPGKAPPLSQLLGGTDDLRTQPLLAAALTIGLLTVLTRALHLDGLADTADGLGSGRAADEALEVMRRGDVGPFGVVTLVLVLLAQVLALGDLTAGGLGLAAVCLALVVSRLVLPLACSRGVPPARADGLGSMVAGSVGRGQLSVSAATALVVLTPPVLLSAGSDAPASRVVLAAGVASLLALVVAGVAVGHAVRRLGGVTGDVLGAAVEVTFTTLLVVLALAA